MTKTYKAIIEGQIRDVQGFDGQQNLVLADGHYAFEQLNHNPPEQPTDDPTENVFGWPLLEIARLRHENGDWFLNNEKLSIKKWMFLKLHTLYTKRGIPVQHQTGLAQIKALRRAKRGELPEHYQTRALLECKLRHLPSDIRSQINGVAWFNQDDDAEGWNTPILLRNFRPIVYTEAKVGQVTQAAANLIKTAGDAARQIRAANAELRASTQQLAEVSQPIREMYKDDRLVSAKNDALKSGVPELVVDAIVSFYHKEKFPTTDKLTRYIQSTGIAIKLKAGGNGTCRATVGRWLTEMRKQMERRGLIQSKRKSKTSTGNPSIATEAEPSLGQDESSQTLADTRCQELGEGPDTDEQ